MSTLHLEVNETQGVQGLSRQTLLKADAGESLTLFHESPLLQPMGDDTPLDGQVLAILLHAMQQYKALQVHGPVSAGMMRNLEELQNIWVLWKPERYKKVDIWAERVIDARRVLKPSRAIAAFSGGADATFTALCHTGALPASVRYPLTDVVMVHGFDVRLEESDFFAELQARVMPLLDELGLPLHTMRTNSRALDVQDWEDSFLLQLSGALQQFSDQFDYALAGSAKPYDCLITPWGSSPLTDYLMSGDQMALIHDGAGYGRTAKIALVGQYPTACQTLKVCWKGEHRSRNCGRCEKCIRTMMNFLAAGHPVPPCFDAQFDMGAIAGIPIDNAAQRNELLQIVRYAQAHKVQGDWLEALEKRLKQRMPWEKPAYYRYAAGLLDRMGLKPLVKQVLGKA